MGFIRSIVMQNSHGDLDLKRLSDETLVNLIHGATTELHSRLAKANFNRSESAGSFEKVDHLPLDSKGGKQLKEPWSCGFKCKWCESACTRHEGHKNHSCYEHRHRR